MDRVPVTPPPFTVNRQQSRALARGPRRFRRHIIRGDVLFVQQRPAPQKQLMTFRFTADAHSPRSVLKPFTCGSLSSPAFS